MLRITKKSQGKHRVWVLAGKLVGPWVAELQSVVNRGSCPIDSAMLDLAEVTFVDDEGVRLLNEWAKKGGQVRNCSPFVAELLGMEIDQ